MRRLQLKRTAGLNLMYEGEEMKFEGVNYAKSKVVTLDDIRPQILNEELQSPEVFYTKYSSLDSDNVFQKKKIKVNLISIPSNVAGIEYVKTKATLCSTHHKIVEVISGGGILMIQRFSPAKGVSEVVLSKVKATDKLIIPAGYSYSFINNRTTPLAVLEFMSAKGKNKLVLDEMKGMAYYVIRKNAKQEIVRNPLYKIVNLKKKVDWSKLHKQCNITPKTPFVRQIFRKYEKFDWFVKHSKDSSIILPF